MKGELVGINEAKSGGATVDNVGYAIPMSKARPILEELMNQTTREAYSEEEQGYFGVTLADVSSEFSQMYGVPEGVCFTEVLAGSPAEQAGLMKGDIVTNIGDKEINSSEELMKEVSYYKAGETIDVTILRADNGEYKEQVVTVTLGKKDVLDAYYKEKEQNQNQNQSGAEGMTDPDIEYMIPGFGNGNGFTIPGLGDQ